MFPDLDTKTEAISACNPEGGGVDDSPEDRRECYFDFLVCIIRYQYVVFKLSLASKLQRIW